MNKRGITKIGLIITLTVLLLSFGTLAITFIFNNPLVKIFDTSLKKSMAAYQQELDATIIAMKEADENFNVNNVTAITAETIRKYIPSFSSQDIGVFEIVNSRVVLVPE